MHRLHEDKKQQLHRSVQILDEQQVLNEKVTRQVSVIVQKNQFRIKTGLHIPSI